MYIFTKIQNVTLFKRNRRMLYIDRMIFVCIRIKSTTKKVQYGWYSVVKWKIIM